MKQHQVFGPFYPVALQSAVNHAERFCGVLADFEARPPSEDEQFLAWLSGREGEVRQVVENVVTDWDGNLQTADGWGMKIEEYLRVLHEALVRFGAVTLETGVPMCCAAPLATTVRAVAPIANAVTPTALPVIESGRWHSGTVVESFESVVIDGILREGGGSS